MTNRWKRRPPQSNWGDFGPDDELGRLSLITPAAVLRGIREVREGHSICLSLPLDLPGGNVLNPRRHPPVLAPTQRNGQPVYNLPVDAGGKAHTDFVCDGVSLNLHALCGDARRYVGYDLLMRVVGAAGGDIQSGDVLCLYTGFADKVLAMAGTPDPAVLEQSCAVLDGRDEVAPLDRGQRHRGPMRRQLRRRRHSRRTRYGTLHALAAARTVSVSVRYSPRGPLVFRGAGRRIGRTETLLLFADGPTIAPSGRHRLARYARSDAISATSNVQTRTMT